MTEQELRKLLASLKTEHRDLDAAIDALTGARELEKEGANVKVDSNNFVRKVGETPKK